MMGIVGQHESQQEILQRGILFLVTEGRFDHAPEGNVEIKLLNLPEHGRRVGRGQQAVGSFIAALCPLPSAHFIKDRSYQVEQFRLVSFGDHGNHLAIQVSGGIIRCDQILDFLEPVLGIEEFATVGNVCSQMQIHQPQFLKQDAGFVCSETAAVQPNVEQPVIFVVRFFGRCIEQELAVGFFPF